MSVGLSLVKSIHRDMSITSGNVGIGRTPTTNKLELEGTASKTTAGDWAANSDIRIKTDVIDIKDALAKIENLRPVRFKYASDYRLKTNARNASAVLGYITGIPLKDYTLIKTGENATGPIAQELLGAYPELVRQGDDGYYQVSELSQWTLVKAIQEQQYMIDGQQKQIEELQQQIDALQTK